MPKRNCPHDSSYLKSNLSKLAYGKYAIGAYNINNMEQTLGLFHGSIESQAPFIIQLSKGARKYADKGMLEAIIRKADEIFPEAMFAVHLDHGDEATCYDCIEAGFYSSVMIDASHESFEENIATTKRVVDTRPRERLQRRGRARASWAAWKKISSRRGLGLPDRPERSRRVR